MRAQPKGQLAPFDRVSRSPAEQPGLGRPVQAMDPSFREWLIDFGDLGYIELYRLVRTNVVLLAIRHQREVGFN